ncbi:MAG TPA: hypothetical protein VN753_05035 [Terracidiphilus sp.]|nr:hypothetical protein [Terracidiphilus sp.]
MPSPHGTSSPNALQPALELIYLATLQPELASQSLRKLLLSNPDYFRHLPEKSFKVVLNMNGETGFESLGCVSYIPLLEQLYASIQLKRDWGYSLHLRNSSSREYVRFYLSLDRGETWHNEGLTAVTVTDEPGARTRIHLVTKRIALRELLESAEHPPLVRAILSWNSPPPPDAPDWAPLWGNVLETRIPTTTTDARRSDRLQQGSWDHFADETESEVRMGRSSDLTDKRPVGTSESTGLVYPSQARSNELWALAQ